MPHLFNVFLHLSFHHFIFSLLRLFFRHSGSFTHIHVYILQSIQLNQNYRNFLPSLNCMSSKECETKLTLENLQEHLEKWKNPYLRQANKTAKEFQCKVRDHRKSSIKNQIDPTQIEKNIEVFSLQGEKKGRKEREQKTVTEQKQLNMLQPKLQEWKFSPEHGFKDYDELVKNYSQVFQKKQKVKKIRKDELIEDFRADERQIVGQIYEQLKDPIELTVSFKAIENFFQSCELFYYFYNIHPYRLLNILKQSAREFQDRLNLQEFFDFFLIDRPTVLQFKTETEKNVCSYSILSQQNWKRLKGIFDTLDTFGNQKICIKMFYQRIRNNPSCINLLSSQAVEYPQIQRTYTLQKILFDLENKKQFESKVDWQTIQDAIINFSHIEHPTLDQIYRKNLEEAKITKNSNYFLLDPKILEIIKRIFNSCPKYCNSFVKTSFFSYQLLQAGLLRPYLDNATRLENSTKNTFFTLEEVIKKFSQQAPNYIDMDEMLEFISIKGFQNSTKLINLYNQIETQSSDESVEGKRQMRKLKKIKSLEQFKKLTKKTKKKPICQITKPKEFNLYHRDQTTIREQRVQEMIKEKEAAQMIQLQKKFKASPIPVTLNPQRYQRYAKLLQKKKNSILNRLGMKRQKDQIIIDYLKSNTKLFESRKVKRHCSQEKQTFVFEASPLPLHLSQELLPKIQAQKLQRRKKIKQDIVNKYNQVYWKVLGETSSFQNEDSLLEKINQIEERQKFKKIKPKQVPNFAELHEKFEEQLRNRRVNFQPTKIEEFKLSSPKKEKNVKNQHQQNQKHQQKFVSPTKIPNQIPIKSTKKYEDLVACNKAKIAQRQLILLEKQKQQEERVMKQKNFAKFMRKYLVNCTGNAEILRQNSLQKMKNYKDEVKRLERQTRQQLAQIYTRVLQKPFLFEAAQKTRKPSSKERPKKVQSRTQLSPENYPYKDGLFEKEGEQFHPIQSENLNQSF